MNMAGPRVTAPVAKLARSITTTTQPSTLLTSSKAAAPLSRKYADLLKERNIDPDHPRHLYTRSSHLPYPQSRKLRLMQTFSSSATAADAATRGVDNIVFPGSAALEGAATKDPFAQLRVPLLPDNFLVQHTPETVDGPIATSEISIVAANPDVVSPSALTEIEGMGMDGVELKFVHEEETAEQEQGMLTDLWRGLVDDMFGEKSKAKLSL
ncbi:hypothetical protein F5Y19DRAFT_470962 [Xylariaceae sp. FL1651]|nr:hypothetical protein F5Y19DRAFT_470962 [Xylariaceae sp. FL1651]